MAKEWKEQVNFGKVKRSEDSSSGGGCGGGGSSNDPFRDRYACRTCGQGNCRRLLSVYTSASVGTSAVGIAQVLGAFAVVLQL